MLMVKRYDIDGLRGDRYIGEVEDGEYILASDYDALAARLANTEERLITALAQTRTDRAEAAEVRLAEAEKILRELVDTDSPYEPPLSSVLNAAERFLRAADIASVPISDIVRSVAEQLGYTPVDVSELEKAEITGIQKVWAEGKQVYPPPDSAPESRILTVDDEGKLRVHSERDSAPETCKRCDAPILDCQCYGRE
jgi:hypothetical protein